MTAAQEDAPGLAREGFQFNAPKLSRDSQLSRWSIERVKCRAISAEVTWPIAMVRLRAVIISFAAHLDGVPDPPQMGGTMKRQAALVKTCSYRTYLARAQSEKRLKSGGKWRAAAQTSPRSHSRPSLCFCRRGQEASAPVPTAIGGNRAHLRNTAATLRSRSTDHPHLASPPLSTSIQPTPTGRAIR
jgi:hypothetical protein